GLLAVARVDAADAMVHERAVTIHAATTVGGVHRGVDGAPGLALQVVAGFIAAVGCAEQGQSVAEEREHFRAAFHGDSARLAFVEPGARSVEARTQTTQSSLLLDAPFWHVLAGLRAGPHTWPPYGRGQSRR